MITVTKVANNFEREDNTKMATKSAFARKDNFWSKLRVKNNVTVREVATMLGANEKTVSGYFTGFLMPDDTTIKRICELFDVDFSNGKLEFQHAHTRYKAEHKPTLKYSAKKKKIGEINNIEDIFLTLYGVVSCAEFIDIYNTAIGKKSDNIDIMGILYGKVDYKTFNKIITMLRRTE